jgi:LuxR family maltose regulon positive regulatory protein
MPLLTTKFHLPPARPNLVPRPRLTARLGSHPLTLISAPAGSGKTTLVSHWLSETTNHPLSKPAWLSLDSDDNDAARFLAYVIAALQTVEPTLGQGAWALLQSSHPALPKTIVTALLNESAGLESLITLVLDDYHLITSPAIHEAVTFLLDGLPPTLRLIITTREDPPLPLARLRARNQLAEIRPDDLRFKPDEAAQFLNDAMGLSLSVDEVVVLEQRTEGWIAGLQLAALALQSTGLPQAPRSKPRRDDVASFIQSFAGSHAHIADYLATEVFQRQPPLVQEFLLQTCHLERLCGALCDAVTLRSDGQAQLERLQQANLFLSRQDGERRWFRYHGLFADFLRNYLPQRYSPEHRAELRRRASHWLEAAGDVDHAIDHALAAGDLDRAAGLIEVRAETWMRYGEVSTILNRLRQLPESLVRTRSGLCVWYGWSLALTHHLDAAEAWANQAETLIERERCALGLGDGARLPHHLRAALGQALAIRALVARLRLDASQVIPLSLRALEILPDNVLTVRSVVGGNIGLAQLWTGDIDIADETLAQAQRWAESAGNAFVLIATLCQRGGLQAMRGQLHAAHHLYTQALALAGAEGRPQLAVLPQTRLAQIHYQWNELPRALDHVTPSLNHAALTEYANSVLNGYGTLARIQQAQGNATVALETLITAEQFARHHHVPRGDELARAWQARLRLQAGDIAAAERWAQEAELWVQSPDGQWRVEAHRIWDEEALFTLCRLLLAKADPVSLRHAEGLLAKRLAEVEQQNRLESIIEARVLQALAQRAMGHSEAAVALLEMALTLAEPPGYVRLFLDEGPPMLALLARVHHSHPARGYASKLLTAFPTGPAARPAVPSLIEPLSPNELEILRLLAQGLSNADIARERVLAVSTVRWYVKHIYRKLGVHNRTQAVIQAEALMLV